MGRNGNTPREQGIRMAPNKEKHLALDVQVRVKRSKWRLSLKGHWLAKYCICYFMAWIMSLAVSEVSPMVPHTNVNVPTSTPTASYPNGNGL
jgi:hypothetical protein